MKKIILSLCFILFTVTYLNSCKKEDPAKQNDNPPTIIEKEWTITGYKNQTGNSNADALQAQLINKSKKLTINLYGSFNGANEPDVTKSVTFEKEGNDTIVYLTMNVQSKKLETAYTVVKGVKQPYVIKHTYINNNDSAVQISVYEYNWVNNTSVLKYQALYEKNNTGTLQYSSLKTSGENGITDIVTTLGLSLAIAETVFYAANGTGYLLGAGAGVAAVAVGVVIVKVAAVATVIYLASALLNPVGAAVIEPGTDPIPPNTPVNNPVPDPIPNLPPTPCNGVNITFTASMDQAGSILISNVQGGQGGYQYSLGNSAFQQSQVFNGPYTAGSYLIMVKNGDGCIKAEVRNINSNTQSCPNTVTDIDGNVYCTVVIGNQTWMVEDLKVTKYRNGDPIANIADNTSWKNLTTGAYCNYSNDVNLGRLYNWHAVNDIRNIAPVGWHIPSYYEVVTLITYLGGVYDQSLSTAPTYTLAGGKMKEAGTTHWNSPNGDATNSSGFTGLPGGWRTWDGKYQNRGVMAFYWTSTLHSPYSNSTTYPMNYWLNSGDGNITIYWHDRTFGLSIRCVKD